LISTAAPTSSRSAFDLVGLVPPHTLDDLWRTLDKIFRFLQAEARVESEFPGDFDLYLASSLENDRELALFLQLGDLMRGFSHHRAISQMAADGPHAEQSIPGRA
jgi:hypothetical protein